MEITKKEEEVIKEAITTSRSMKQAAKKTGYSTAMFKNRAVKLGIWSPIVSGLEPANKLTKEDLIAGKTTRHSYSLKKRLIDEDLLKDECNKCSWFEKRDGSKYTSCHLHHKDGDENNNQLNNLELLCPNCHSLTPEYCKPKNPKNQYTNGV